jgi:hypothetical protein
MVKPFLPVDAERRSDALRWSPGAGVPGTSRRSGESVFDERLQPGERLIPLLGDEIEVFLHPLERPRIECEAVFATCAVAAHDSHALQHTKMFGDRLAG